MKQLNQQTQGASTLDPINDFVPIDPGSVKFDGAKKFKKVAEITARPATVGEVIVTIAGGIVETRRTAELGDYLVTNPDGEQYLVPGDKFDKKYALKPGTTDTYVCIAPPVRVVFTDTPVAFTGPWGEKFYLKAQGALVEHPRGCYGVQPQEFRNTYQPVD